MSRKRRLIDPVTKEMLFEVAIVGAVILAIALLTAWGLIALRDYLE